MRSPRADYAGILDSIHKETCEGAIRDFEPTSDALNKATGKEKASKEKARANRAQTNEAMAGGDDTTKPPTGRRGEMWSGDQREIWRKQQETHDTPDATKTDEKPEKEKTEKKT